MTLILSLCQLRPWLVRQEVEPTTSAPGASGQNWSFTAIIILTNDYNCTNTLLNINILTKIVWIFVGSSPVVSGICPLGQSSRCSWQFVLVAGLLLVATTGMGSGQHQPARCSNRDAAGLLLLSFCNKLIIISTSSFIDMMCIALDVLFRLRR